LNLSAKYAEPAKWRSPSGDEVRGQLFTWLETKEIDESIRAKINQTWSSKASKDLTGTSLLAQLSATCALIDPNASQLIDLCSKPHLKSIPPDQLWLADPNTHPIMANNFRLLYGRWLVHQSMFDKAAKQLSGLKCTDVVDPASLLFYQSVVYHRLMNRAAGLETIELLTGSKGNCPHRYLAIALLMKEDLLGLKDDSLDHIARRMEDIQRRLKLGQAGKRVCNIEDGIIKSLDKLINNMEDKRKGASGENHNRNHPSKPAGDSHLMGGGGSGEVTKKRIGNKSGWGSLPPKQRNEALQQIGRNFPSHYYEIIEQYFRELAAEKND